MGSAMRMCVRGPFFNIPLSKSVVGLTLDRNGIWYNVYLSSNLLTHI
jgi:hypothetical protein